MPENHKITKSILEEGLPRFVKNQEEATALSCSACGAPSLRGAPMCFHCGSGLNSEILFDVDQLRLSADELNWEDDCYNQEPPKLFDTMKKIVQQRKKDVFLLIRGIPLLVKVDDNDNRVISKRFSLLQKLKSRDELGDSWYQALKRFHDLQKTLSLLSPDERMAIHEVFYRSVAQKMFSGNLDDFFIKVDFSSAEELFQNYPGNDAQALNRFIDVVREMMAKVNK